MPTYEYRCRTCGHQFEVQQSFSEDALTTCDQCQGELRKVFAPVGITFKGSGFYKTDNRSGSSSGSSGSGSPGSSGSSTGGSDATTGSSSGTSSTEGGSTAGSSPGGASKDRASTASSSGSSSD